MKQIKSTEKDFKRNDSNRQESNRKVAKPQNSQPADSNQNESKNESSFWLNFKKHRPSKNKSTGQGSRRKKRTKRK